MKKPGSVGAGGVKPGNLSRSSLTWNLRVSPACTKRDDDFFLQHCEG